MCDLAEGLVTLVGPAEAMVEVVSGWDRLNTSAALALERPQIADFERLDFERQLSRGAPMIGRLHHQWQPGVPVAERLQAEMILNRLPVMVEPEHNIGLCGGSPTGGSAGHKQIGKQGGFSVEIDNRAVATAFSDARPGAVRGYRVAVIDSGDLGGKASMTDFTGGLVGYVPADDQLGHGTAVSEVIRRICPHADVSALRVVNAQRGTSYELLCAMAYALWSGMFDVVNVSLSAQTLGACMTVLGGSLGMVLSICEREGARIPEIVAAAGNTTTGQGFGYPARLPGTTVVQAWDFSGQPASYNVDVPNTHHVLHATGGDEQHSFGSIVTGGTPTPIFGTSFAAAVVTGVLVS